MKTVSLSVPFVVLSTKVNQSGDVEKHVMTPFGDIDLSFRMAVDELAKRTHYEIEVEGDIEHWMLDADLIAGFRKSLLDFIRGISEECLNLVDYESEEVFVQFKGADFNVRTSLIPGDPTLEDPLSISYGPCRMSS
ncbi:hypothetical protein [Desulfoferrobacter suflitae]|uniref:hypothetical protein n=1 Tax=Desulfoferrobacter suflitae TaxID=2865782 RepID=UPI0021648161|nr:hypothetical protein [Desulfoferrobacter suflitae]MCK8603056.1 hypothetical protein [Desulfoferrobacter suflitae]